MHEDELLQSLIIDLRRGTLVLAVLSMLAEPKYGYSLLTDIEGKGIHIEANTLYPLLRRLENQSLLYSKWDTAENRPRKYYNLSETGEAVLVKLRDEWRRMSAEMETLLSERQVQYSSATGAVKAPALASHKEDKNDRAN